MSNAGVQNPEIVDLVSYNAETDVVTLSMIEERAWDGSEWRVLELEAKIQNYFSFVVDGQLIRQYPAYVGKPVEMRLFCSELPDAETNRFIEQVRAALTAHDIGFVVSRLE